MARTRQVHDPHHLNFPIERSVHDRLSAIAAAEGLSLAQYLRRLISEHLQPQKPNIHPDQLELFSAHPPAADAQD